MRLRRPARESTRAYNSDAFGHALYDRYRGQDTLYIIERDDGYIAADSLKGYFSDYRGWPAGLRRAMSFARGRVLDVGCGAGRAALYLQRRGLVCVGVDNSPLAVRVCKLRGLKHARLMAAGRLSRALGVFDTILMLGNNFGLAGDPTRTRWLLRRFRAISSERARIIAETLDPKRTRARHHRDYHRRNRQRGRMPGQVRLRIRYLRHASPWFDYLFVSKREMRALLKGTGWHVRRFLDIQGSGYIAVLEKAR